MNVKLTETRIFLYLIKELSNSIKELSNTTYPIRELFNWIIELCN